MERDLTGCRIVVRAVIVAVGCAIFSMAAGAHCDTINGPVVIEAKTVLEKGDVTPILKWIRREDEPEIKVAFQKAAALRFKGSEEKELADRYFLETAVRLHRASEGEPYTGIKAEAVEPIVAMADKAILDSSANEMIQRINEEISETLRQKLQRVLTAMTNKDRSVEAGRDYVKAYVDYMHYVENIHTALAGVIKRN
jgi:hypothetical protein